MNYKTCLFALLLCAASVAVAETKEYTVLGNQKIKAKAQDGMPLPAAKDGVTIQGAGFALGEGKLIWSFDFISRRAPTRVLVEDISGPSAIVLVEDSAPKREGSRWSGGAAPVELSRVGCPWLYEPGNTTKVFRFTVALKGKAEPVVIHQPAIYTAETKRQLQQMVR